MTKCPGIVVACVGGAGAHHGSASTTQITEAAGADPGAGFERYRKPTRRDAFLSEMQTLVPWAKLVALIEPHFPRSAKSRRPVGLECMLRIRLLQHWFKLADAACEEALYDSAALLAFSGIELSEVPVPDAITILEFRHRLDKSGLGHAVFAEVECNLLQRGLRVRVGTIVDAAILQARRRPQ